MSHFMVASLQSRCIAGFQLRRRGILTCICWSPRSGGRRRKGRNPIPRSRHRCQHGEEGRRALQCRCNPGDDRTPASLQRREVDERGNYVKL